MNKRIIRDEPIKNTEFKNKEIIEIAPNNQLFHPTASLWIKNVNPTNPICLTKFQMDSKKNLNILNEYKCKTNPNTYKKNLYIPPIGLDSNDLLNIYSVDSIDSLNQWVTENLSQMNYLTINRVLNSWIRVNFDTLKNYNNYLEKIYIRIIEFNFRNDKQFHELEKNVNKEIKDFIDYWINKHSADEFNLNLLEELKHYLKKKFNLFIY